MVDAARRFVDQATARAWLGQTFGGWADGLSGDEQHAVREYKDDDAYRTLNHALRTGERLTDQQATLVRLIDSAVETSRAA